MGSQSQTRLKQLSMHTCSHGEHRTAPWEAGSKLGLPGKRQDSQPRSNPEHPFICPPIHRSSALGALLGRGLCICW